MKSKVLLLPTLILTLGGMSLWAAKPAAAAAPSSSSVQKHSFSDTREAGMLHHAYRILAAGDHDYRGHRVAAMKQVKKAAALLHLDLRGDDRIREKQPLSDDRLREARGMLHDVLNASAVKDQKHVSRHIEDAIKQINTALKVH